jgi:hypothetical protein
MKPDKEVKHSPLIEKAFIAGRSQTSWSQFIEDNAADRGVADMDDNGWNCYKMGLSHAINQARFEVKSQLSLLESENKALAESYSKLQVRFGEETTKSNALQEEKKHLGNQIETLIQINIFNMAFDEGDSEWRKQHDVKEGEIFIDWYMRYHGEREGKYKSLQEENEKLTTEIKTLLECQGVQKVAYENATSEVERLKLIISGKTFSQSEVERLREALKVSNRYLDRLDVGSISEQDKEIIESALQSEYKPE